MKEETVSAVPVNSMGASGGGTGGIATFDPLLKKTRKLYSIVQRVPLKKLRKKV